MVLLSTVGNGGNTKTSIYKPKRAFQRMIRRFTNPLFRAAINRTEQEECLKSAHLYATFYLYFVTMSQFVPEW